jgi:DnaJ-domain-containing protein 1
MATLSASSLHQFRCRLEVPSAVCRTDSLSAASSQNFSLRTPFSVDCQPWDAIKTSQSGFSFGQRKPHFRSGSCSAAASSTVEPMTMYSTVGMRQKTHYDVLGISKTVSDEEIKAAFRRVAKESHPDHAPAHQVKEYQRKFMEAHKAYSVLKDPRTRQLYNYEIRYSIQLNTTATLSLIFSREEYSSFFL